jgi:hypothetical protein
MSRSARATSRRRSGRSEPRPLVFPAQRQAAREQAARLGRVSQKVVRRVRREPEPRRLPRPVVWLLWLGGAALASVLVGFLMGLARPRSQPAGQI